MTTNANSSIRNIKHSAYKLKKDLIQNMVTNKLSTVSNLKVKCSPEPTVSLKSFKMRPKTYSKENFNTQKVSKEKSIVSYVPKYRQNHSKNRNVDKLLKDFNKNALKHFVTGKFCRGCTKIFNHTSARK